MPELPEAEANRARVEAGALHRTVTGISIHDTVSMEMPTPEARRRFEGRQFTEARRHGKQIFVGSASGPWLAVHLGMTGSLRPYDGDARPDHAKLVVAFEGERRLAFRCPRKFGRVRVTDDPDGYVAEAGLGPDALEIGAEDFAARIGASRGALKSALMAQDKLAGIGNLWSDEILYRAGHAPETRANRLADGALGDLHRAMREILRGVVQAGADYSKLPDDWLIHHREAGAACPRCGGTIAKATVGGRSAYHCRDHQEAT